MGVLGHGGVSGAPVSLPVVVRRERPAETTAEVVEATVNVLRSVQLSKCKCGFVGETKDPRVLHAVDMGMDFNVPCRCGRVRQIRGQRIISVANRGRR